MPDYTLPPGVPSHAHPVPATAPVVPWLHDLAPTVAGARLMPASSGAQYARAVYAVGPAAAQWAVEVGHEVTERVAAELPNHTVDGGYESLRMGTESTTLQLLIALSGVEIGTGVTPESLAGIPDFVRRRVSLDELLRGIQLGHSVIAAAFLAGCGLLGDPEQRHEQMRALSQRMFTFFDTFSAEMATFYREEEGRWRKSDAASRLAFAEELLRGQDHPIEIASRRLRYDLERTHVAVIVWSTARTLDADQQRLFDTAVDLMRRVGCDQKLVLSVSPGAVWIWTTPKNTVHDLADRLSAASLPADTHAVFGDGGVGLDGFRTSHQDADAAFRLRSSAPSAQDVTPYRDLDLLSLLMADRERGLRFARAELGALGAEEPAAADLRTTLSVYLQQGGSPLAAARRLNISRNTVTYRMHRAEELLGRPLTERRLHLEAALAILAEHSR